MMCIELIKIAFSPRPSGGYRFKYENDKDIILNSKTGYTLYDDKMNFPSIFENVFTVEVTFSKDSKQMSFLFDVYGHETINGDNRYRWNNADIKGILNAFCSKDDRRIILPSGIHDYCLEFKKEIYSLVKSYMTIEEYRCLTSDIFIYLCIEQGFSPIKAKIMGKAVDCFQKLHKESWKI